MPAQMQRERAVEVLRREQIDTERALDQAIRLIVEARLAEPKENR